MPAKLTDEEYDARLCAGYNVGSIKELVNTETFKKALAANKNDLAAAMRSLETKREVYPSLNAWFVAAVPAWDFQAKALSGKTIVTVVTAEGDVIEKSQTSAVPPKWTPLQTKVTIGPVIRTTFLLKDTSDPKRVQINYKEALIKAVEHDDAFPEVVTPSALDAIRFAGGFKAKGRKIIRAKSEDVHVRGTITDDLSQIRYREGGDYAEQLSVVIRSSDGAIIQANFKADSPYSPDWVAKTFGIEKDEAEFQNALANAQIFARGQLGLTMPWEPTKGENALPQSEVNKYVEAFRERGYLVKEEYKGKIYERLSLAKRHEEQKAEAKEASKVLPADELDKSIIFCGREVVDLELKVDDEGNENWVAAVLMTDQPGKYPWFAFSPGKQREGTDQPPTNSGAFFVFLERQEGVELALDDAAAKAASRYANLLG